MILFTVHGTPTPQGGMRAVPTARGTRLLSTGGAGLRDWRTAVSAAAADQADLVGCQTVPLEVTITFRFPMPKSAPRHDREHGIRYRTRTPDIDKLTRAVLDSLTAAGLIADDSLVVALHASKVDVWQDWTGCTVRIEEAMPL